MVRTILPLDRFPLLSPSEVAGSPCPKASLVLSAGNRTTTTGLEGEPDSASSGEDEIEYDPTPKKTTQGVEYKTITA